MTWLVPLGFLGLLGIIALIVIYIIKPNYQNKFISSTYVWKLSLKYKKKKLPINTLRNILLFICQMAIIAGAASIIARPFLNTNEDDGVTDVIMVIDASASMQADNGVETRLERAATAAMNDAKQAFADGKRVSVILASGGARFLVQDATAEQSALVYDALEELTVSPEEYYTFGAPDVDGAMKIAEQITAVKENTSVTLYTDVNYLSAGKVTVRNVAESTEWNAAILDVRANLVENLYRVEIDVACYGTDARIPVVCEILNIDGEGTNLSIETDAYCNNDAVTTLVLGYVTDGMSEEEAELIDEEIFVTEFDQVYVHISEDDSLAYDNQFSLYGGRKPTLRIQYYSTLPNTYWRTALDILSDVLADKWKVEVTEIRPRMNEEELATEGFDLYIFEHNAPTVIPDDGIVIYSDVTKLPAEAGVRFGGPLEANGELFLTAGEKHPITEKVTAEKISVTAFTSVIGTDGYVSLLNYEDYPMLLVKEDVDQKIVLMPFSVHYSNLVALPDFPVMLSNIMNHFFRETIQDGYVYEPGDLINLDARADILEVSGPKTNITVEELPGQITLSQPGAYTLTQVLMSGNTVIENIYVKIPASESNIVLEEEALTNPYFFDAAEDFWIDLLFYFALAVVVLLFLEGLLLHSRKQN